MNQNDITSLTRTLRDMFTRDPLPTPKHIVVDKLTAGTLAVLKGAAWSSPVFAVGSSAASSFLNSWTAASGSYAAPSYTFAMDGRVLLQGAASNAGTVTLPSTIFTLPPRYRPLHTLAFPAMTSAGLARIEIDSSGNIRLVAPSSATTPTAVTLDGITFATT